MFKDIKPKLDAIRSCLQPTPSPLSGLFSFPLYYFFPIKGHFSRRCGFAPPNGHKHGRHFKPSAAFHLPLSPTIVSGSKRSEFCRLFFFFSSVDNNPSERFHHLLLLTAAFLCLRGPRLEAGGGGGQPWRTVLFAPRENLAN